MADRIRRHQADRPEGWTTLEVARDVGGALDRIAGSGGAVVVDCVTLWLSNLMLGLGGGPAIDDEAILAEVGDVAGRAWGGLRVIWVSNEVGSGGVPADALARRFADLQGRVNQAIAAVCDAAYLCVAGLPVRLK